MKQGMKLKLRTTKNISRWSDLSLKNGRLFYLYENSLKIYFVFGYNFWEIIMRLFKIRGFGLLLTSLHNNNHSLFCLLQIMRSLGNLIDNIYHFIECYFIELISVQEQSWFWFSQMTKQKKVWSQVQDQLLKKLYEQDQMRNWSLIAKRMFQQYKISKKSGKQCRQRYQNHIDTSIVKIQWTIEQQKQLIQLHNQIGNKWANIAIRLPGKSDNCIKNHFYSKLRKLLRKLNKLIHQYYKKQFRQININVIYKIVEATEERFKEKPNCSIETSDKCKIIQNKMLQMVLGGDEDQQQNQQQQKSKLHIYKQMIYDIYSASKQYKRKSKKSRNLSIQAPNIKKAKESRNRTMTNIVVKVDEDGYMSDSSNSDDGQAQSESQEPIRMPPPNTYIVNEDMRQQNKPSNLDKRVQVQEGTGIHQLLKQSGILQNQYSNPYLGFNNFKFSQKSSFKSYSDRGESDNFNNILDDSENERGMHMRKNSNFLYFNTGRGQDKGSYFSEKE